MKLYKGLVFFGITALTKSLNLEESNTSNIVPIKDTLHSVNNRNNIFQESNNTPLTISPTYVEDHTFLGKIRPETIEERAAKTIIKKLESMGNTTTLSSLEDTITIAKQLNIKERNRIIETLFPSVQQYLIEKNLDIDEALDEATAYIKSSNLTTLQELLATVDGDTKIMLDQTLDKFTQTSKGMAVESVALIGLTAVLSLLLTVCCCIRRCDPHDTREDIMQDAMCLYTLSQCCKLM